MYYNKIIILSAPSGAGKTTLARHLLESGLGLEFSVSACSRAMRTGETDGKDYYFLTPDEFRARISAGKFVEWEEVYPDHYYGTLKSEIERINGNGNFVLFDVDVKGGISLKKIFGDTALSVFIMPPSIDALRIRLESRGTDTPDKISLRLAKAEAEMADAPKFDTVIVNDDLDRAKKELVEKVNQFLNA
jgi:guanylate kinase